MKSLPNKSEKNLFEESTAQPKSKLERFTFDHKNPLPTCHHHNPIALEEHPQEGGRPIILLK